MQLVLETLEWADGLWNQVPARLEALFGVSAQRTHTHAHTAGREHIHADAASGSFVGGSGFAGFFLQPQALVLLVVLLFIRHYWISSPVQLQMPKAPASIRIRRRASLVKTNALASAAAAAAADPTSKLEDATELVPLDRFVVETCPHLAKPGVNVFHPHPIFTSGNLQTIYAALYQRVFTGNVNFDRELLTMPDGGLVSLDWKHLMPTKPVAADEKVPYALILHGLTGGSHETYVQDLVEELLSHGIPSVVMNFRGCSNTPLVTPQLYSGAYTGDIKYVVGHIINKIPNVSLFAFGFSLGSNVLIKYAGEMGESCPLAGCCSIGNPYDFLGGLRALHRTWFNRTVYSTQMAKNLSNMFRKHSHAFKDILEMDHEAIYNAKYLVDFDEACTRRAFNFRSADEYYRHASCAQHVPDVAIPTLLFSALDDPIAPPELIPYRESRANPHVILATTAHGGHLGWFDGTSIQNILFPGRRWFAKPVAEFAKAILLADVSLPVSFGKKAAVVPPSQHALDSANIFVPVTKQQIGTPLGSRIDLHTHSATVQPSAESLASVTAASAARQSAPALPIPSVATGADTKIIRSRLLDSSQGKTAAKTTQTRPVGHFKQLVAFSRFLRTRPLWSLLVAIISFVGARYALFRKALTQG